MDPQNQPNDQSQTTDNNPTMDAVNQPQVPNTENQDQNQTNQQPTVPEPAIPQVQPIQPQSDTPEQVLPQPQPVQPPIAPEPIPPSPEPQNESNVPAVSAPAAETLTPVQPPEQSQSQTQSADTAAKEGVTATYGNSEAIAMARAKIAAINDSYQQKTAEHLQESIPSALPDVSTPAVSPTPGVQPQNEPADDQLPVPDQTQTPPAIHTFRTPAARSVQPVPKPDKKSKPTGRSGGIKNIQPLGQSISEALGQAPITEQTAEPAPNFGDSSTTVAELSSESNQVAQTESTSAQEPIAPTAIPPELPASHDQTAAENAVFPPEFTEQTPPQAANPLDNEWKKPVESSNLPVQQTASTMPAESVTQPQTPTQPTDPTSTGKTFSTFYLPAQPETSDQTAGQTDQTVPVSHLEEPIEPQSTLKGFKANVAQKTEKARKFNYKPFITAAIVGVLFFGLFNSQVILGQVQYLTTPSGGLEAPAIDDINSGVAVGPEPRIIIPKINVDVPVVYDEPSFSEEKVQKALERGVVHYGSTGVPGEIGNNVIVGHSSNNWWNSGKYKFAFVLLDKLEVGDTFVMHYESQRYVYEVYSKKIIKPTDLSVLKQTKEPIVTLITCTPPGTSWQRLVVQAKQISPDPGGSKPPATQHNDIKTQIPLPGDTSNFFSQMIDFFRN